MKLYYNPKTRGRIVEWYVKELNLPDVETVVLDWESKEHKQAAYRQVHPFGRIPALSDGDMTLFESGAILMYLAEKYGGLDTTDKRAMAAQWVFFAFTTLAESAFDERRRATAMPEVLGTLDARLAESDYLVNNEFSVTDVAVGSTLWWVPMVVPEFQLAPYPNVVRYVDRLKARPAFGE